MDILQAVTTRKSIRGFKKDPVPEETLRAILSSACRAPSGSNIQPWEFTVIAGDVLENLRRDNVRRYRSEAAPAPEHSSTEKPPGSVYRTRQVELGSQLYRLLDIARGDMKGRLQWRERGVRYFDAPAAIIVSVDRSLSEAGSLLDIGAVAQTICLAAMHFGLGACISGQGVSYPDIIRAHVPIPAEKRIVISIAIGYPDWDDPVNRLMSTRAGLEEVATWHGFDAGDSEDSCLGAALCRQGPSIPAGTIGKGRAITEGMVQMQRKGENMTPEREVSRPLMIMNSRDNVAVCLRELNAGEAIDLTDSGLALPLQVLDAVPLGHKVALAQVPAGEPIIKYGEVIGRAIREIRRGQHVHTHNISDY